MPVIKSGNYISDVSPVGDMVEICDDFCLGSVYQVVELDGSSAYDLDDTLPIKSVVVSAQLKLDSVVATTAVKVGLGRKESTADPDKYLLSTALTDGTYGGAKTTFVLADDTALETLQVTACDTNGAAAGTLDTGTVTVCLTYMVARALA